MVNGYPTIWFDMMNDKYFVLRQTWKGSGGDFMTVFDVDTKENLIYRVDSQVLADLEDVYQRKLNTKSTAYHRRPMFYTGSPYGRELVELYQGAQADGKETKEETRTEAP